ncbi:MAG TPA: hypothetical protein VGP05_03405 [Pseudonocardia sp.]|nr:hypothetical protein [Pseudonocardia sp.]
MITYQWYTGTAPDDGDELRRMLADAAAEDAEAGFPKVTADESDLAGAAHLLVCWCPTSGPATDAGSAGSRR